MEVIRKPERRKVRIRILEILRKSASLMSSSRTAYLATFTRMTISGLMLRTGQKKF